MYNATSQVQVSFDDAPAFAAKGTYIAQAGLRGFALWEAGGDYKNVLLDAIREGVGAEDLVIKGHGFDDSNSVGRPRP